MNFGNLLAQRFSSKAVEKNSSFLCSGFLKTLLKMSKLKTTSGSYLNRRKIQLFSD